MNKEKLGNIPSGHDGDGYVTLAGQVLAAFRLSKISAQLEIVKESKRFLGERLTQNAARGMDGKGNLTYYHTTAAFIKAMKDYQNGGAYPDITIQYYSESPEHGRCEVVLRGVVLDTVSFGALDDSSDNSQQTDTAFSFNDFDIVEAFV